MTGTTLQPQLRSMRDILRTSLLEVPRYQRPYSWTPENVSEFLEDVMDADSEGYFIGPMVIYRSGARFTIVDGQQRLTTIVLLLSVLRDFMMMNSRADLAAGIQNFIETKDEENDTHYVLVSQAAGSHLFENHLRSTPGTKRVAENEDQKNIDAAAKDLRNQLLRRLSDLDDDGLSEEQASEQRVHYLNSVRSRLLGVTVIWFPLDSVEQAYAIFETLNSRGKDLDTVDLLKNLLLSGLPAENSDHDPSAEDWSELRRILEEDGKGVVPNMFIHHWWVSRASYLPERRVYVAIRKQLKAGVLDHGPLLQDLLQDASLYARVTNPAGSKWTPHELDIREGLAALNIFGVRQPRPLLLAALRAHRDGTLTLAQLKALIRTIESFHYLTTAVMRLSSSGGVSVMYASYAKRLTEAKSKDAAGQVIKEIRLALKAKVPADGFEAAFVERLRYSKSEADQKELVFYTMRKMQRALRPKNPLDNQACNVEHLEAQSRGEIWSAEVGNLFWMSQALNERLGDKAFEQKVAILRPHRNELLLGGVLDRDSWTASQVRERSQWLAKAAMEKVWTM